MHAYILWDLNCKFGSLAYHGHTNKLMELYLWRFKLEVSYPVDPQKPDIQMRTFLTFFFFFFFLLFFSEKNKKPIRYTRTPYSQIGKNTKWAETFVWCLLLIFKVAYRGSFDTVTSLHKGFRSERAAVGLGPSGLKKKEGIFQFPFFWPCCNFWSRSSKRRSRSSKCTQQLWSQWRLPSCHI